MNDPDARVLNVETSVAQEILYRHDQVNALSSAFVLLLDGRRGEHTFLVGPSGSGKTCVARYALRGRGETFDG